MHNKRKNAKDTKLKTFARKSKHFVFASINSYVKLLLIWSFTMFVNLFFGLRSEFAWPAAICCKNLFDRYNYSGLKSVLLHVLGIVISSGAIALTLTGPHLSLVSNICSWLHLLIFYIGNGSSITSFLLVAFFTYVEVFLYVSGIRPYYSSPDKMKLFTWISVGYFFFLLSEFILVRCQTFLRIRTQRSVQSQNASYYCLLETALPEDLWCYLHRTFRNSSTASKSVPQDYVKKANAREETKKKRVPVGKAIPIRNTLINGGNQDSSQEDNSRRSSTDDDLQLRNGAESEKERVLSLSSGTSNGPGANGSTMTSTGGASNEAPSQQQEISSVTSQNGGGANCCDTGSAGSGDGGDKKTPRYQGNGKSNSKDETTAKLEAEARKLRSELHTLRSVEADLRSQMTTKAASERASRAELEQVKNEFEMLTGKLQSMTERIETDRKNLEQSEHRLSTERKVRQELEQQLTELRKSSAHILGPHCSLLQDSPPLVENGMIIEENGLYDEKSGPPGAGGGVGRSCKNANTCSARMKKLENDIKALTKDLTTKESQIASLKSSTSSAMTANGGGPFNDFLAAASSLAVGAAITPGMSEQLQIKQNEFQQQELSNLRSELQRLQLALNDEEDHKQKITQAYYESLKKVTDLQATLADKECEISQLNEQLDRLTPSYFNLYNMVKDSRHAPSAENMMLLNGGCLSGSSGIMSGEGSMADGGGLYSMRSSTLTNGHSHSAGHVQHHLPVSPGSQFQDTELRYRPYTGMQQQQHYQASSMRASPPSGMSSWFPDGVVRPGSPPATTTVGGFSRTPGRTPQSAGSYISSRASVLGPESTDFYPGGTSFDFRPPSPRDFIVPASMSTGRSRIVDNYYAKMHQGAENKSSGISTQEPKAGSLLFTLDDGSSSAGGLATGSNSSNDDSPPPHEEVDERCTMRILEGMLDDPHQIQHDHDMFTATTAGFKRLKKDAAFDDLNTLD